MQPAARSYFQIYRGPKAPAQAVLSTFDTKRAAVFCFLISRCAGTLKLPPAHTAILDSTRNRPQPPVAARPPALGARPDPQARSLDTRNPQLPANNATPAEART